MNSETINVNGVTYYAKAEVSINETKLRNLIEEVKWYTEDMVAQGRALQKDFSEQGLTIGAVEAEGFLRCALQLESWLDGMTEDIK